jgi:hypothetical protein
VLGILWFFTRKYEIPQPYKIATYDKLGGKVWMSELRTVFSTHSAAVSFAKHYAKMFPNYDFVLEPRMPLLKRATFTTFRRIIDNAFSCGSARVPHRE